VTGPAYGAGFKWFASVASIALAASGLSAALRYPELLSNWPLALLLLFCAVMLGVSYYWFLHAQVRIDEQGITQTGMIDRRVAWSDVRGARLLGIATLAWLIPPRLVVRTGNALMTFNAGTAALRSEFARIAAAYGRL
jgi:hypothetical protein